MTLLKRLLTAAALFLPLLVIIYFGICIVGGGIAGARIGLENPKADDLTPRSEEAGRAFVQDNIKVIVVGSFGGAGILSLAIPFSGLLPWCRKPRQVPPPLPPQFAQ
jgi:hypothetical protein